MRVQVVSGQLLPGEAMSTDRLGAKGIAVWDERRNSSRVFPVSQEDVENAQTALARFKASQPDLYEWVASGAPNLTEGQHVAMFGEQYRATRSKKASA